MPPRTVRTSAVPVGSGEKNSSSCTSRNPPIPGRTSASKDFILPKYANNRIPAKPGVRSCSLSVAADVGEERKVPSSNLPPPSKVIEGRIAKPSSLKSEVTCRSVGQRTSSGRRPQSLLVYSSASCDHLTASSSSLFSPASRLRKRGIPAAYSTLAKEASVTSSIRSASRERKIGSITPQTQRQESAIIRPNERRADEPEHGRKPPQSVAKVTPFPLTKTNCDAPHSATKEIRTNDGKESSDQQPVSNNTTLAGKNKKGSQDEESGVGPDSETDGRRSTQSSLPTESDHGTEDASSFKDTPSMQCLSLMIASYKVKSRKLRERLDQGSGRRLGERGDRQEQPFDDSYSDTECSRTLPECDHGNQTNASCPQTSPLIPTISGVGNRFSCLPKNGTSHSRRQSERRADVNNQASGYCLTVSDAGSAAKRHRERHSRLKNESLS